MRRALKVFAALALSMGTVGAAQAGVVFQDLGTVAPPSTLGGFSMIAFGADPSPEFTVVSSIATPTAGSLGFSTPVQHMKVGSGWATWSNGYTGDVYYTSGLSSLTMTLTPGVNAFDFYAEPGDFSSFTFTVTTQDNQTFTTGITGNAGAHGFGVYGTSGTQIASVTVSTTAPEDFAVGEFAVSGAVTGPSPAPEPATITLLGVGVAGLFGYRFRRRKSA